MAAAPCWQTGHHWAGQQGFAVPPRCRSGFQVPLSPFTLKCQHCPAHRPGAAAGSQREGGNIHFLLKRKQNPDCSWCALLLKSHKQKKKKPTPNLSTCGYSFKKKWCPSSNTVPNTDVKQKIKIKKERVGKEERALCPPKLYCSPGITPPASATFLPRHLPPKRGN